MHNRAQKHTRSHSRYSLSILNGGPKRAHTAKKHTARAHFRCPPHSNVHSRGACMALTTDKDARLPHSHTHVCTDLVTQCRNTRVSDESVVKKGHSAVRVQVRTDTKKTQRASRHAADKSHPLWRRASARREMVDYKNMRASLHRSRNCIIVAFAGGSARQRGAQQCTREAEIETGRSERSGPGIRSMLRASECVRVHHRCVLA